MKNTIQTLFTGISDDHEATLLTIERLAEITVRVQNADLGPWTYDDNPDGRAYGYVRQGEKRTPPWPSVAQASRTTGMHTRDNGQFIAHAREDVPDLLSEIRLLRYYLLTYGAHAEQCPTRSPLGEEQCTCGWGLVLAQLHT